MSSVLKPADEGCDNLWAETTVDVIELGEYRRDAGITHAEVLKSDTEGYDLEVLHGAERLLRTGAVRLVFREVLFADLDERTSSFDVIDGLLHAGDYRLVRMYEPHHTADGRRAWCDALFVHCRP